MMRSTVRIDDDLLLELKERARKENLSLTKILNRSIREGLRARREGSGAKHRGRRTLTFSMGSPAVDLTKALSLATTLEDAEVAKKLALRK